jgi:hypothetical protein
MKQRHGSWWGLDAGKSCDGVPSFAKELQSADQYLHVRSPCCKSHPVAPQHACQYFLTAHIQFVAHCMHSGSMPLLVPACREATQSHLSASMHVGRPSRQMSPFEHTTTRLSLRRPVTSRW